MLLLDTDGADACLAAPIPVPTVRATPKPEARSRRSKDASLFRQLRAQIDEVKAAAAAAVAASESLLVIVVVVVVLGIATSQKMWDAAALLLHLLIGRALAFAQAAPACANPCVAMLQLSLLLPYRAVR